MAPYKALRRNGAGLAQIGETDQMLGDASLMTIMGPGGSVKPVPEALADLHLDARAPAERPDGAVGNGIAVDADAFAAMLTRVAGNSASARGKGATLPSGVYVLDKQLVLNLTLNQVAALGCVARHGARLLFTNPQSCGLKIVLEDQIGISQMLCQAISLFNITILSKWLKSDITGGGTTAGIGLEITNKSSPGKVLASPLPAVQLDNVSVHNTYTDTIDWNSGASGWNVHVSIFGVNMVNSNYLNCFNCMPGSTVLKIDADVAHPSFLHKHNGVDFNGSFFRGVLIGKAENDVPLQGFSFLAPTLVSAASNAIGLEAFSKYLAVNYVGDDIEVIGGHINCGLGGMHFVGWRAVRVDTYCLVNPGGFGVQLDGCGGLSYIKGIYNLQGYGNNRAVVVADHATGEDAGLLIDFLYNRAIQPPVLLIETTNNAKISGVGQCSSFVPMLSENGAGIRSNHLDYVCNGVPIRPCARRCAEHQSCSSCHAEQRQRMRLPSRRPPRRA